MKKKYVLCPGKIYKYNNGASYSDYVSAISLAYLYGVNLNDCYVVLEDRPETLYGLRNRKDLVWLFPRKDGNYERIR